MYAIIYILMCEKAYRDKANKHVDLVNFALEDTHFSLSVL